MARREASRCGEAQADYGSTKSCAEGSTETDTFCEPAGCPKGSGYRISWSDRFTQCRCRAETTPTQSGETRGRPWAEVADGKCHSGRIAECVCCWKETGSAEPFGGEAFRGTWWVACSETWQHSWRLFDSETFRNSGRFADTNRRQTDDPDYTRTETVASRSGAGNIAQCPKVGSTEPECSQAVGDSGTAEA